MGTDIGISRPDKNYELTLNWEDSLLNLGKMIVLVTSLMPKKTSYRSDEELHHIVAHTSKRAIISQGILADLDIGINSEENTVLLKTGLHRRLHTNAYYLYVEFMIISAYLSAPPGNIEQQKTNVKKHWKQLKIN